jgi:hypothetical protein
MNAPRSSGDDKSQGEQRRREVDDDDRAGLAPGAGPARRRRARALPTSSGTCRTHKQASTIILQFHSASMQNRLLHMILPKKKTCQHKLHEFHIKICNKVFFKKKANETRPERY